jgi:hypothetical protein
VCGYPIAAVGCRRSAGRSSPDTASCVNVVGVYPQAPSAQWQTDGKTILPFVDTCPVRGASRDYSPVTTPQEPPRGALGA